MIHVLAYITAKPGQREALLKEFRAIIDALKNELALSIARADEIQAEP